MYLHFNSTIVRLKDPKATKPRQILTFQFYDSTIKRNEWTESFKVVTNFNSTIVRLKALIQSFCREMLKFQFYDSTIKRSRRTWSAPIFPAFQFYDSTIKSIFLSPSQARQLYFNSTIVRLKEAVFVSHLRPSVISILRQYD